MRKHKPSSIVLSHYSKSRNKRFVLSALKTPLKRPIRAIKETGHPAHGWRVRQRACTTIRNLRIGQACRRHGVVLGDVGRANDPADADIFIAAIQRHPLDRKSVV